MTDPELEKLIKDMVRKYKEAGGDPDFMVVSRKDMERNIALNQTAEIIAELERLKQGHNKPLSAGNAEILLNAIDDRIKYYKAKETQL